VEMVLEYPAFEVVVRCRGTDILVAAFFPQETGGVDVALGCEDEEAAEVAIALMQDLIAHLPDANWQSVDDSPVHQEPPSAPPSVDDMNDIPF